jgi:hypothetical protein
MVAVLSPHRTHSSVLAYLAHMVAWWLTAALSTYGLMAVGAPYKVDWSERRPRYWRHEARRGLRECELILRDR